MDKYDKNDMIEKINFYKNQVRSRYNKQNKNNKGPVCFNKKLIEEEVKFFSDLAVAVSRTSGLGVRHEEVKQSIIDGLPEKASNTIYETLRLGEFATPRDKSRTAKRVADDALILDCSIDEFYNDLNAANGDLTKDKFKKTLKDIMSGVGIGAGTVLETKKTPKKFKVSSKDGKVKVTEIKAKPKKKRVVKKPAKKAIKKKAKPKKKGKKK